MPNKMCLRWINALGNIYSFLRRPLFEELFGHLDLFCFYRDIKPDNLLLDSRVCYNNIILLCCVLMAKQEGFDRNVTLNSIRYNVQSIPAM